MIRVIVTRTVERPEYQVFTSTVDVRGDKLTPEVARAAISIAFGSGTGTVTGPDGYGYKIYPNSHRKFTVIQ